MTQRIWIDTDIGDDVDDAIALALAVHHPDIALVGVSTVGGDVEHRADLARRLLDELGNEAPVFAGAPPPDVLDDVDAFLSIGPLTNTAVLLEVLPQRVVVMGGATRPVLHRDQRHDVEYNFAGNPRAAATVVRMCKRAVIVPLEVTTLTMVPDALIDTMVDAVPPLRLHVDAWRTATNNARVCLHDPLALLVLAKDAPVTIEVRSLEVRNTGRLQVMAGGGESHPIVTGVDADAAVARVLELVEGASD